MGASSLQAVDYPSFPFCYRGKVLDNADPEMKGRIKVQVYPMFSDLVAADIDWSQAARPAFPLGSGAGTGFGNFMVPEIGSFVFVFFEAGDFNQCVYFAEAATATMGLPTERTTNYPKMKVWKTASGVTISVNDQTKEITITQGVTGGKIVITADGKFKMGNATGDVISALKQLVDDLVSYYQLGTSGNVLYNPAFAVDLVVIQTLLAALKGA